MSGHFILWNINQSEIHDMKNVCNNINWSDDLVHIAGNAAGGGAIYPGWTPASIATISGIEKGTLADNALLNRDGLPPHRYLLIPGGALSYDKRNKGNVWECHWLTRVVRPKYTNINLKELTPKARAYWNEGKK